MTITIHKLSAYRLYGKIKFINHIMNKKRKINEIFRSLQGEGANTGCSAVFVRFSGCNLKCPFCDTKHQDGEWLSDEDIIARVKEHPSELVVLTGGEPSLWIDSDFIRQLKEAVGRKICIETNGTHPLPSGIDWITLSPKMGLSPEDLSIVIPYADEIKVVDCGQNLDEYFKMPQRVEGTLMYLQPCYVPDPTERDTNIQRTISKVEEDPRWRLSAQLHRLLNFR